MEFPLEVSVRGEGFNWEEIERDVQKRASKLGRFSREITKMRVVVDSPHRKRRDGIHHAVKIEVSLPGKIIVVNREHHHRDNEDVHVCVKEAFLAAQRQIEDYCRIRHNQVKQHEGQPVGKVINLFPHMDYGFIQTPEGTEVYFHRNSVLGQGFDALEIGELVRFNPESGLEGPQASTVVPMGRSAAV